MSALSSSRIAKLKCLSVSNNPAWFAASSTDTALIMADFITRQ